MKWSTAGKSATDLNNDPHYLAGQIVKVAGTRNDAYQVDDNSQVRQLVFSTGDFANYKHKIIDSGRQRRLEQAGYLMDQTDWTDVEITGYFYVINRGAGTERGGPHIRFIARGGRQSIETPCEGASYHAIIKMDGSKQVSLQKEIRYSDTEDYSDAVSLYGKENMLRDNFSPDNFMTANPPDVSPSVVLDTDYYQKWVGIKFVVYNLGNRLDREKRVKLEVWIDKLVESDGTPANAWQKVIDYVDAGQWCKNQDLNNPNMCGGTACQRITWGSPMVTFRWDNLVTVWYKSLSVRKIVSGSKHPVNLSTAKTLQTTSTSTADTQDLEDGDFSTWPEAHMPEVIGVRQKQDYGIVHQQTEIPQYANGELYSTKTPSTSLAVAGGGGMADVAVTSWYQPNSSELLTDPRFSITTAGDAITSTNIDYVSENTMTASNTNFSSENFSEDNFNITPSTVDNLVVVDYAQSVSISVKEQWDIGPASGRWYTSADVPFANQQLSPRLLYQSILKILTPSFASSVNKTIGTSNQYELERQGFMFDESDYTNVEITAYVNLVSVNQDVDGQVSFTARGSDAAEGCEGTSYQVQFFYKSGKVRVIKELSKGNLYVVSQSYIDRIPDLRNRWTGLKAVIFNYRNLYDVAEDANENVVVIEAFVDRYDDGRWEKILSVMDDGRFHTGYRLRNSKRRNMCAGGGTYGDGQAISWGGPVCMIKLHNIRAWSFKKVSVREIEPPQYLPYFSGDHTSLTAV